MTNIQECNFQLGEKVLAYRLLELPTAEVAHTLGLAHYWRAIKTASREDWEYVIACWSFVFENDAYWVDWGKAREEVYDVPITPDRINEARQQLQTELADKLAAYDSAQLTVADYPLEQKYWLEVSANRLLKTISEQPFSGYKPPACGPLLVRLSTMPRPLADLLGNLPAQRPSEYESQQFILTPLQDGVTAINEQRLIGRKLQLSFSQLGMAWTALEHRNPYLALDSIAALSCPDNDSLHQEIRLSPTITHRRCRDDCSTFQQNNPAYATLANGADLFFHHLIELAARANLTIADQNIHLNPIDSAVIGSSIHAALDLAQIIGLRQQLSTQISQIVLRWTNTLEQTQRFDEGIALLEAVGELTDGAKLHEKLASIHYSCGLEAHQNKDYKKAVDHVKLACENSPNHLFYREQLVIALKHYAGEARQSGNIQLYDRLMAEAAQYERDKTPDQSVQTVDKPAKLLQLKPLRLLPEQIHNPDIFDETGMLIPDRLTGGAQTILELARQEAAKLQKQRIRMPVLLLVLFQYEAGHVARRVFARQPDPTMSLQNLKSHAKARGVSDSNRLQNHEQLFQDDMERHVREILDFAWIQARRHGVQIGELDLLCGVLLHESSLKLLRQVGLDPGTMKQDAWHVIRIEARNEFEL